MSAIALPIEEKKNKTPEYILKANRDYYQRRKESDSEFVKKKIEQSKKWRDEHRDQYNANERARKELKKNSQVKKESL
jgi:hypothetical protein